MQVGFLQGPLLGIWLSLEGAIPQIFQFGDCTVADLNPQDDIVQKPRQRVGHTQPLSSIDGMDGRPGGEREGKSPLVDILYLVYVTGCVGCLQQERARERCARGIDLDFRPELRCLHLLPRCPGVRQ
jgi:hypothetical protein